MVKFGGSKKVRVNMPNPGASYPGARPGLGRAGVTKMLSLVGKGGGTKSNNVFMMNQVGTTGTTRRRNWGGVSKHAPPAPAPPAPAPPAPAPPGPPLYAPLPPPPPPPAQPANDALLEFEQEFKEFDLNKTDALELNEVEQYLMAKVDTNKDGQVDYNEYRNEMKEVVLEVIKDTAASNMTESELHIAEEFVTESMFKEMDTDQDGYVEAEEYRVYHDADGDEKVTAHEVLSKVKQEVTDMFDMDGDNIITKQEVFFHTIAQFTMSQIQERLLCHPDSIKKKIMNDLKHNIALAGVGDGQYLKFEINMNTLLVKPLDDNENCDECNGRDRVRKLATGALSLAARLHKGVITDAAECIGIDYKRHKDSPMEHYEFFPMYTTIDEKYNREMDMANLDAIIHDLFPDDCALGVPTLIQNYASTYGSNNIVEDARFMVITIPPHNVQCPVTKSVYLVNNTMNLSCHNAACQTHSACIKLIKHDFHLNSAMPSEAESYKCMVDMWKGNIIKGLLTFNSHKLTVILLYPTRQDSY